MTDTTRRAFTTGIAVFAGGVVGSTRTATADSTNGWTDVDSPTGKSLDGVTHTTEGPFAVGAGGNVIRRNPLSGDWEFVLENGPSAKSNTLNAVDVTDDGQRIWFDGGSGVIGEYDVVTDTLVDFSAPGGKTSTWEDIAVAGLAGQNEAVYLANGSGEVLVGRRQTDGSVAFGEVVKPGGGSTIPGIDLQSREDGHACSTSQAVFETDDGNAASAWEQIGIANTSVGFSDIASVADDDVTVVGGSGRIFYYNGNRWTPITVGESGILAVDRDSQVGLAAGAGGFVYERESATEWSRIETPVTKKLKGVANDPTGIAPDVAVGASGTIVERRV